MISPKGAVGENIKTTDCNTLCAACEFFVLFSCSPQTSSGWTFLTYSRYALFFPLLMIIAMRKKINFFFFQIPRYYPHQTTLASLDISIKGTQRCQRAMKRHRIDSLQPLNFHRPASSYACRQETSRILSAYKRQVTPEQSKNTEASTECVTLTDADGVKR